MSAEYVAAHKAKVDAQQTTTTIPGMVIVNETKKKKKKSKSKTNTAIITDDLAKTTITESEPFKQVPMKSSNKSQATPKPPKSQPATTARQDGQSLLSDDMKRLKNLRKKIREIETLEGKIKFGEIKNPEKEMLEKVSRKKEIMDEIKLLESNQ